MSYPGDFNIDFYQRSRGILSSKTCLWYLEEVLVSLWAHWRKVLKDIFDKKHINKKQTKSAIANLNLSPVEICKHVNLNRARSKLREVPQVPQPVLDVHYELNPVSAALDLLLRVTTQPIDIVYNEDIIDRLNESLFPSGTVHITQALSWSSSRSKKYQTWDIKSHSKGQGLSTF